MVRDAAGLLGIVGLPALRRVWIEGNPVLAAVRSGGGSSQAYMRVVAGDGIVEVDALDVLPRVYGIEVCDLSFKPDPRSFYRRHVASTQGPAAGSTAAAPSAPVDLAPARPRPRFIGDVLRRAPGGMMGLLTGGGGSSSGRLAHEVAAEQDLERHHQARRNRRRDFRLTDEEVRETVRAGRILTLAELRAMRRRRAAAEAAQEDGRGGEMEAEVSNEAAQEYREQLHAKLERLERAAEARDATDGATGGSSVADQDDMRLVKGDGVGAGAAEDVADGGGEAQGLQFDRGAVDSTFLTAVHIIGGVAAEPDVKTEGTENEGSHAADDSRDGASWTETGESSSVLGSWTSASEWSSNAAAAARTRWWEEAAGAAQEHATSTEQRPRWKFGGGGGGGGGAAGAPAAAARAAAVRRELARTQALPATLQGSLRALRQALQSPASYWRVLEES
ncbi:hypothetical protein HK405_014778, partial [Cladochytrium tenue]